MLNFRAIGFDYSGVIAGQPGFMGGVANLLGVPLAELKEIYFQHNRLKNVDGVPHDELWKIILGKIKREEKSAEVLAYITAKQKQVCINTNMIELIDRLRSLGYKTSLLSNNDLEAAAKMRHDELDRHFDAMVVSAEVGYQKPSPEIFNLFIEKLEVRANELLFVDDSEQSLSLSKEIGFYPVHFKNYDDLVKTLAALVVLTD